jgi:hypothetical protein
MNKKGMFMLYIIIPFFILGIVLFFGNVGKQTPGGEVKYLGQNEIELFQTYQEGEQELYYIDLAATLAAKGASQETEDLFKKEFEEQFKKHLAHTEVGLEDYSITYTDIVGVMTIEGTSSKEILIEKKNHKYSVVPNFKVSIGFEIESK